MTVLPILFYLNLHSHETSIKHWLSRMSWYLVGNLKLLFIFFHPRFAQRLLSEVAVVVSVEDKAVSRYWVSVSPLCPDGSTAKDQSCSGVQPDQTVNKMLLGFIQKSLNHAPRDVMLISWIGLCWHIQTWPLRALHDRKDLVNNPSWADYRLYLTGKHFHVIP